MTEILEEIPFSTQDRKLYSSRTIGIATFIGSPIAAGYLLRENYITLRQPEKGNKAFAIGILATLFIFAVIFLLPEAIMNKIPNAVIPVIYTGITYWIVSKTQGPILDQHKAQGYEFYSAWRAAGIGLIACVLVFIAVFGVSYVTAPDDSFVAKYNEGLAKFTENESQSLEFYTHAETRSNHALIQELDETVLPKWNENVAILTEMSELEGLPEDLSRQDKIMLEYAKLRIEAFELIRKDLDDPNTNYSNEINQLHVDIQNKLNELK